jgi:hypothetical protein
MTFAILVTLVTEPDPVTAAFTGTLDEAIAFAREIAREGFYSQRDATTWDAWPADAVVKVRVEQEPETP